MNRLAYLRPTYSASDVGETVEQRAWLNNIPELSTRRELLAEISKRSSLRKAIFNAANDFENVALIPDPCTAQLCLSLFYRHAKARFEKNWRYRLSQDIHRGDVLWAEMHGLLRNIYRNMRAKVGNCRRIEFGQHDVEREYR